MSWHPRDRTAAPGVPPQVGGHCRPLLTRLSLETRLVTSAPGRYLLRASFGTSVSGRERRRSSAMSDSRHDVHEVPTMPSRRAVLKAGALMAAAPLVGGVASRAEAAPSPAAANGPVTARAYGTASATGRLEPLQVKRRAVGPHDVLLDVLYCGICHSDIHQARNEWSSIPTTYPCVPGHEIIGRVAGGRQRGDQVQGRRRRRRGLHGRLVRHLRQLPGRPRAELPEGRDLHVQLAGPRHGREHAWRLLREDGRLRALRDPHPAGRGPAATAPLLCAGITTFSPMQHWKLSAGQRVGVIGLGGLGHMAVKLAAARKAEVTVFTTSPGKIADAQRLGAKEAVLWSDAGRDEAARETLRPAHLHRPAGVPDAAVPRRSSRSTERW